MTSCRGPSSKGSMIIRSHHRGSLALKPVKLRISLVKNFVEPSFSHFCLVQCSVQCLKQLKRHETTWRELRLYIKILCWLVIVSTQYGFIIFYPLIMGIFGILIYIYIYIYIHNWKWNMMLDMGGVPRLVPVDDIFMALYSPEWWHPIVVAKSCISWDRWKLKT